MKVAFVVGFFQPVQDELRQKYPEEAYRNRLIWIDGGQRAITVFKERFYDVVRTASGVLVCLGRSGRQRHTEDAVRGIIGVAESQYSIPINLVALGNLYDHVPVVNCVDAFRLDEIPEIGVGEVKRRIGEKKILCVSPQGKTTISTALERVGFTMEAIVECFDEEIQEYGKNSNLMQHLKSRSNSYCCLLYAWEGLRTSDEEVKNSYEFGCYEAVSAAQVAESFRKWITEGV